MPFQSGSLLKNKRNGKIGIIISIVENFPATMDGFEGKMFLTMVDILHEDGSTMKYLEGNLSHFWEEI